MDVVLTCQGGDYTRAVHGPCASGWGGFWIDVSVAAHERRQLIVLDPVNLSVIKDGIKNGTRDLIGELHGVIDADAAGGLFNQNLVEWTSA